MIADMSTAYTDLYHELREALMFDARREVSYPILSGGAWSAADVVSDDCADAGGTTMVDLLGVLARAAQAGDKDAISIIDGICTRYAEAYEGDKAEDLDDEAECARLEARFGLNWDNAAAERWERT